MKIGILTYYKVKNFGANLQAVSTYMFLKKNGHEPIFINYILKEGLAAIEKGKLDAQWKTHLDFVNSIIKDQTPICQTSEDIIKVVDDYHIDALIVGSDALLQHHPFITRIRKAKRKIVFIMPVTSDRLFPNVFWGCGVAEKVPMALMSVSSQNSEYNLFLPSTKKKMKESLSNMCYISVRDSWTQDMLKLVLGRDIPVTPDPVFAFQQNAGELVPTKEDILRKYNLPENYALMSLFSQCLSEQTLDQLKLEFNKQGISFGILPLPTGVSFNHNVNFEIPLPLSPIDWYALIKYSKAYVGSNMHPIVCCLHNAVPCFSIDNWGRTDFWGHKYDDGSSKVQHIMNVFGVGKNHRMIDAGKCNVSAKEIIDALHNYPYDEVREKGKDYVKQYNMMMKSIITSLEK